jgi:hypothetical protein
MTAVHCLLILFAVVASELAIGLVIAQCMWYGLEDGT